MNDPMLIGVVLAVIIAPFFVLAMTSSPTGKTDAIGAAGRRRPAGGRRGSSSPGKIRSW